MIGASVWRQIGEKAIKATIAIVGLLVLRLILVALPMLRHPILYMSPASGGMGTGISAAIDLNGLLEAQQTLNSLPPAEMQQLQRAFAGITPVQAADFQKAYDQLAGVSPSLSKLMANALARMHLVILPITIANAIIDTLIFVVLLFLGRDMGLIMRSSTIGVNAIGPMLNLAVAAIVVAFAYNSYKGVAYPFLQPDDVDIFGWVFLALGLAPLVGISVLVARNIDAITTAVMRLGSGGGADMAMRSGTATRTAMASATCSKCGYAVSPRTKFCANCAAPVSGGGRRFCGSCGAENSATAKFCGGCGEAFAD